MEKQNRKLTRLKRVDYGTVACYLVTLCTHHRQPLFSMEKSSPGNSPHTIPNSPANQIIHRWLAESQNKFKNIAIDQYVIMSDHLHLIANIKETRPGCTLADAMRFFKTMTTNEYIRGVKQGVLQPFDEKLWQKSYYDHVIRNQQDFTEIWEYIENNPVKWMLIHGQLP